MCLLFFTFFFGADTTGGYNSPSTADTLPMEAIANYAYTAHGPFFSGAETTSSKRGGLPPLPLRIPNPYGRRQQLHAHVANYAYTAHNDNNADVCTQG